MEHTENTILNIENSENKEVNSSNNDNTNQTENQNQSQIQSQNQSQNQNENENENGNAENKLTKLNFPKRKYAIIHGYNGHNFCGNQK
jgi:hypothetical protein